MKKKTLIGVLVGLVFILIILIPIIGRQIKFKKQLTNELDSLKKQYDFIDSYETDGYHLSHLTIKVNDKFSTLSNNEKYKKMAEIDDEASSITSGALYYNKINFDARSFVNNQLITFIKDKDVYTFDLGTLTLPDGTELRESEVYANTESTSNTNTTDTSVTSTSSSSSGLYPCEPSEENKGFAWAAAMQTVKENLKAPSTADFPFSYYNQEIKEVGYNVFEVNSYVDAQNSFGAEVRSNFSVRIKKTGEESYIVESVSID